MNGSDWCYEYLFVVMIGMIMIMILGTIMLMTIVLIYKGCSRRIGDCCNWFGAPDAASRVTTPTKHEVHSCYT